MRRSVISIISSNYHTLLPAGPPSQLPAPLSDLLFRASQFRLRTGTGLCGRLSGLRGRYLLSCSSFYPKPPLQPSFCGALSAFVERRGNQTLRSQSEIDQGKLTVNEVIVQSLWRPFEINILDPSVLFTSLYVGLMYGIFYSFFEVFPFVYATGLPGRASPTPMGTA